MDEQSTETAKTEESKGTTEDTTAGVQSETAKETEQLKSETEELNKQIAEKANADARAQIAGVTGGKAEEAKPLTQADKDKEAIEYSEQLKAGKLSMNE